MNKLIQPGVVYSGSGSISGLPMLCLTQGFTNVLIFTDLGVRGNGLLEPVTEGLSSQGITYTIVDSLKPEPSYLDVQAVLDQIKDEHPQAVIGVGGGSVMDAAKLCSLLLNTDTTVKELLDDPDKAKKQVPSIMIPTTCGTGSEATINAIVLVPEKDLKVGIVNGEMISDYVILDANMISRLPGKILAATAVDALAHCVECYTSNKANPLSDLFALGGARLIFENIETAFQNPEDLVAKSNLLLGSYYGGNAITGSGTTAVHALSYPLGGKYHIPHGVSNAILFAHVMQYNKDAIAHRLTELFDTVFAPSGHQAEDRAQFVIDAIARVIRTVEIPTSLDEFGVKKEDLDFLVDSAYEVKRLLNNNLKVLDQSDIRAIYEKVL